MTNITRYDINEHGELPLSNGRYVRWEDVEDLLIAHDKEIDRLEDALADAEAPCCDYDAGYEDGKLEGFSEGHRSGLLDAVATLKERAKR